MSLVVLDGVTLSFGDRALFSDLGLRIGEADRIGLIGPNGSGKTTLLRLIAGRQQLDRGSVQRSRGVRVGYLAQDIELAGGAPLLDFVIRSVPGRAELDRRLAEAEAELERLQGGDTGADDAADALMELAQEIADIHERIDHFERYFSEHEATRILAGLGFVTADLARDIDELSGGWRMRAVLAALLFQQPELLLLDEPTNHLDMPSVAWFSEFLRVYQRAFVLISHDREFLNEQIQRVVSLEPEGVRTHPGDLASYARRRAEEEQVLENQAKNLAREKERLQRFVDRFRAQANKARAVQSRVKMLEKMDEVETFQRRRVMRFSFPPVGRTVGEVARVERLEKRYGDHVVLPGIDLVIRRGDAIGIIGPNGAGKTTLLKLIAGELAPSGGRVVIGNGVTIGYYAQHHADTLHPDATVYDEVARANPDAEPSRIRSILGAFLFSGDDVDKKIQVLSGGERARVALARLLVNPGHLVLMDEPTNHLDLDSSDSLAESLAGFDGTLIFVSHNRSLIRRLAKTIWNLEDGRVEVYPGTLDEYLYSSRLRFEQSSRAGQDGAASPAQAPATPPRTGADAAAREAAGSPRRSRDDERARRRREAEERQRRAKRLGPIQRRIDELEARIATLEARQHERSAKLSDPSVYEDQKLRDRLIGEYQAAADKLEELTGRWESLVDKLEAEEAALAAEDGAGTGG